jgi:hypothetical protein
LGVVALATMVTTVVGAPLARAAVQPPPPPPPFVLVYGDSLVWEAKPYADDLLHKVAGIGGIVVGAPGKATCDLVPLMRDDARRFRPTAVVLAFSGNALTPCMQDEHGNAVPREEWIRRYVVATRQAIEAFAPTGAEIWLGTTPISLIPEKKGDQETVILNYVYRLIAAATPHVHIAESADAVLDHGYWARTKPCTPFEPCTAEPDNYGRIWNNVVRSPDGTHFCPVPYAKIDNCPVYTSGGMRFAAGLLFPTLRAQGVLPYARLHRTIYEGAA